MAAAPKGANVEIIEYVPTVKDMDQLPCIKPTHVLVNGTDVGLVKKGSLVISEGDDHEPASVTLTLYPKSIVIAAEVGP